MYLMAFAFDISCNVVFFSLGLFMSFGSQFQHHILGEVFLEPPEVAIPLPEILHSTYHPLLEVIFLFVIF